MNFNELNLIIRHIRKTVFCNNCGASYGNTNLEVLSTFDDQGLIHLGCPKCKTQTMVHVTLSDQEAKITTKNPDRKHKLLATETEMPYRNHKNLDNKKESVTLNDVIDTHAFLNKFDGNFKALFSNTNQS